MQGNPAQMICVLDGGEVVGLLNLKNLLELIRRQNAVDAHHLAKK